MDKHSRRHIDIRGGGFGGTTATNHHKNTDVDVTCIDRSNHHLFQPLLYQVATAALSPGDIAAPIRAMIADAPNISVLMRKVEVVYPDQKKVELEGGQTIDYD